MFNFRKYSYDDSYEEEGALLLRSDYRQQQGSWNLLRFIIIALAAIGGALIILILWFTWFAIRHEIHHAADSSVVLAATPPPPAASSGNETIEPVIITLGKGSIEGKRLSTREGREYLAFVGIPYAKPPVGELRFQPPVEGDPWNGTLIVKQFKPRCIQKLQSNGESNDTHTQASQVIGSEDCLYLNVFTPKTLAELTTRRRRRTTKLPVMVYIHGGLWGAFGHADKNGGEYLLDEDVILVTHHYRLGVLGNLNTMDSFARGNQGQKDTVMVLRWIQNNIESFGGDPKKVTMFGESYGSMSTTAHLISPMSKGLFHRAICQSGSILMSSILTQNTLDKAHILGSKLNCSNSNSTTSTTTTSIITTQELAKCLQSVDVEALIVHSHEAPLGQTEFIMSVEPNIGSANDDVFLPDFPLKLYLNGSTINRMPVMIGITSAEMLPFSLVILSDPELAQRQNQVGNQLLIEELKLNITSPEPENLAAQIREFYMSSANFTIDTERNFTFMLSDRSYNHPVAVSAHFQFQANNASKSSSNSKTTTSQNRGRGQRQNVVESGDVYLYLFNQQVNNSRMQSIVSSFGSGDFLGAMHTDELQYLFPSDRSQIPVEHPDYNFSRTLVRLWTSFANNGVPEDTSNSTGIKWNPITGTKPAEWFRLEEVEPKMITNEDRLGDRMKFWDSFDLNELYL